MKKLALVLMLLTLPFSAQATTHYEETTTLYCKISGALMETFVLDAEWFSGSYRHKGWTVKRIKQRKYSIEVLVQGPKGETVWFDFNNGWPCKVETRRKLIQPESDNFNQID